MLKRLLTGFCLTLSCLPLLPLKTALADVKNVDYQQQELEVTGSGQSAEQALEQAEILALEKALGQLLQTEEERQKFEALRPQFYSERSAYVSRLKIIGKGTTAEGGRFYTIRFAVNVGKLRAALVEKGVILSVTELRQELNAPMIAVYYKDPQDQSSYALWSVERLNHFLLSHRFQVVAPEVWQALAKDDQLLSQSQQSEAPLGRLMAMKANADIFLVVEIDPKVVGRSGDYTYVQTPVKVEAYECSSGEPFIVKVYQRLNNKGEPEALALKGNLDVTAKVVIEEAVAGAMPLVLHDLTLHWKKNLVQGQQYRLEFKLPPAQLASLSQILGPYVKSLQEVQAGVFLVRFPGPLSELADKIEEELAEELHLKLLAVDLGTASFGGS